MIKSFVVFQWINLPPAALPWVARSVGRIPRLEADGVVSPISYCGGLVSFSLSVSKIYGYLWLSPWCGRSHEFAMAEYKLTF